MTYQIELETLKILNYTLKKRIEQELDLPKNTYSVTDRYRLTIALLDVILSTRYCIERTPQNPFELSLELTRRANHHYWSVIDNNLPGYYIHNLEGILNFMWSFCYEAECLHMQRLKETGTDLNQFGRGPLLETYLQTEYIHVYPGHC
jgi:hypothetical protein